MIDIAFLFRIYTLKKKYESYWAKYGRKNGNFNVRGHTLKTVHKEMQKISQNYIAHMNKGKTYLCVSKTLTNPYIEDEKL